MPDSERPDVFRRATVRQCAVLVGGLGTFEGAILGAVIFFAIEAFFGAWGVWCLVGLGAVALGFALLLPRGIFGWADARFGLRLLPVGYRLRGD